MASKHDAGAEPDIYHDSPAPSTDPSEYRRVAFATMIGTTIEWYDYFIYANIAALLFKQLFFNGLGDWGQLVAYATIGISFFFRPAGAIAMGWVGDRWGRRAVLVMTLGLMGASTFLIGCLPTADQIGIAAPLLLLLLRCLQGFSAGGEWGGAAMLAVEHAPHDKRGVYGSYVAMGVPVGMILAAIFMMITNALLTPEQFASWGWRIGFWISIILIAVGQFVRAKVRESPVFEELKEVREEATVPQGSLLHHHFKEVITAAGSFLGNNGLGYMLVGGFIMTVSIAAGIPRGQVLWFVLGSAAMWWLFIFISARMSDHIGRTRVFKIGYGLMLIGMLPTFWLVAQGISTKEVIYPGIALLWIGIPLGMSHGPQSAMFAEMFPANIRLSGVNLAYAIGAVLGGAFAPMVAEWITGTTKSVFNVAWYIGLLALLSFISIFFIKDRTHEPLHTMSGH